MKTLYTCPTIKYPKFGVVPKWMVLIYVSFEKTKCIKHLFVIPTVDDESKYFISLGDPYNTLETVCGSMTLEEYLNTKY